MSSMYVQHMFLLSSPALVSCASFCRPQLLCHSVQRCKISHQLLVDLQVCEFIDTRYLWLHQHVAKIMWQAR